MTEVRIITPTGMFGATAGEHALVTAMRIIGVGFGDTEDWCAKYGANVENEVFLMKRYCWCEKDGECPWCTGCAAYTCAACECAEAHSAKCFQKELQRRFAKYDEESGYNAIDAATRAPGTMTETTANNGFGVRTSTRRTEAGEAAHKRWCKAHDEQSKEHARLTKALYIERGRKPEPYQWLCDCGAKEAGEAIRTLGGGCDYHHGRGIFARFAPYQHMPEQRYYDPPNFWFKPTNFRLTWYKYIGRDMASNNGDLPGDFMERVFATHPKGMTLEDAIAEAARQEEETAVGFSEMFASLGIKTTSARNES